MGSKLGGLLLATLSLSDPVKFGVGIYASADVRTLRESIDCSALYYTLLLLLFFNGRAVRI